MMATQIRDCEAGDVLTISLITAGLFAVLVIYQTVRILTYVRTIRPVPPTEVDDAGLPKFAVLMPLRGDDPFLSSAINSVLDQDYPNFELHIIVDHPNDPAWQSVREVLDKRPADNVRVSVLEDKPPTCGLICSAVRQFIRDLDDTTELVIVCAADMTVPRNWLKEAAVILQDPKVGATLGNRWFMPREGQLGSLVRYVWNSAANVSLYHNRGVWSGGMALRVKDVRALNLPEIWGRSMVEDMTVAEPLEKAGLILQPAPTIVVVNREETTVPGNFRFIRRQLLFTYLYHPRGFRMITDFALMSIVGIVAITLAIFSLATGHQDAAATLGGTIIAAGVLLGSGLLWMESRVRRIMRARGEATTPIRFLTILKLPLALLIAQVQHLLTIPACLMTRRVLWRGITYRLDSAYDVKMDAYHPFEQRSEAEAQRISV